MQCLIKLERPERMEAKMELMTMYSELMPQGKPDFLSIIKYTKIETLITSQGRKKMMAIVVLMVKDFCASMNVVRNMNDEQMIEAASMLIDECDNFRLEDYAMMFQMAKRGELIKIMDRIDLQIITLMLDEYWKKRKDIGEIFLNEGTERLDSLGNAIRKVDNMHSDDVRMISLTDGLCSALSELKNVIKQEVGDVKQRHILSEIEKHDMDAILKNKKMHNGKNM